MGTITKQHMFFGVFGVRVPCLKTYKNTFLSFDYVEKITVRVKPFVVLLAKALINSLKLSFSL